MDLGAAGWLLVDNALAITIAWAAAQRAYGRAASPTRVLASVVGFPVVIVISLLLLGMLGALHSAWLTATLGIAAGWALWARAPGAAERPDQDSLANEGVLWFVTLAACLGATTIVLAQPHLTGFWYNGDDLSYHGVAAASWLQGGPFHLPTENFHAYYPFNAELLALWFMLPTGTDALAGLAGALWLVVVAVAVATASLRLGVPRSRVWLPVLLVFATRRVLWPAARFGAVDVAGAGALLAAVSFALPGGERRTADASYAGLLAGFAVGCKISFAPTALLLLARGHGRALVNWKRFSGFTIGAVFTGSFWYLRNVILTGNPFFPAALGPFAGPFGSDVLGGTRLIAWILERPSDLDQWTFLLRQHLDWPLALGGLALFGYATGIRRLRSHTGIALVVACGGLQLATYPFMPFSGTDLGVDSLRIAHRFLIFPYVLGLLLFAVWASERIRAAGRLEAVLGRLPIPWTLRPIHVAVALALGLALLLLITPRLERAGTHLMSKAYPNQANIGNAWLAIDGLPAGSQIAAFGDHAYHTYPLNGRHFQLRGVSVDGSGRTAIPLHQRWQQRHPPQPGLAQSLAANLRASKVDFVLVTRGAGGRWPPQQAELEAAADVSAVYRDEIAVIWALRKQP